MALSCPLVVFAPRSAREVAAMVSCSDGPIRLSSSARVSRTEVFRPGSETGMTVSTSADSASLASTQSRRSRVRASLTAVSFGSRSASAGPSVDRTCWKTASSKSTPPRCSTPSGLPRIVKPSAVFSSTHTSNVPPPRSYTATRAPGDSPAFAEYWIAAACGSGQVRALPMSASATTWSSSSRL